MKDGKNLRISTDYVAVDVYEDGVIKETPIYLSIHKPTDLMWLDREEGRYIKTTVTYNGTSLDCKGDMEWQSDIRELLTEVRK